MKTYNIIKQLPREAFVLHIRLDTFISCTKVHLIHFIQQSPAHSLRHSFPSHSSYRSQSISFTFTISGYTHTASYFNLIVSGNKECLQVKFQSEIHTVSFEAELLWYYYSLLSHRITTTCRAVLLKQVSARGYCASSVIILRYRSI